MALMDYNKTLQTFGINYIKYCKSQRLNISSHCRYLEKTKGVRLGGGKTLWNWKCGQTRIVTLYTIYTLAESLQKPISYFFDENFKLPDTNE